MGDDPLPEAGETLARLRDAEKTIRFLTNDPRPGREQVSRRLTGMGVEATPEDVVTCGRATAAYLRKIGAGSAYVVGSRGLASEVGGAGVEVVDRGPCEAVVVGCDEHVSYAHIRQASRLVFEGARFVATNEDGSFPSPKGPLPATGAIVAAIRATTDREPVVIGKPYPAMFDMALEGLGVDRERVVMVGDSPDTDIAGARRAGISGVLVDRGGSQRPQDEDQTPDAVIPDLAALFDPGVSMRDPDGWLSGRRGGLHG